MAKSDDGKTYRLTDMVVKEVSLVDRAANKREFLITKRDGSSMASKLVSDGRGGFTTIDVAKSEPATPAVAAAAPVVAPVAGADHETEVEKAETISMMGALAERILTVAKAYRAGEAIPDTFNAEIEGMQAAIRKRRMGKARMDKFETGIASLQELLAELKGETETTKSSAPALAPPAATAVAAVAPVAAPATPVADLEKADLAATVKKQETELAKLRGTPRPSNSEPLEGGGAGGGGEFAWPTDMAPSKRHEANKRDGLTF